MPPDPLNGLGLTVELNLGLEKSGRICTSNYMVCRAITDQLLSKNLNGLVTARAFRRRLLQNYSNFQTAINP